MGEFMTKYFGWNTTKEEGWCWSCEYSTGFPIECETCGRVSNWKPYQKKEPPKEEEPDCIKCENFRTSGFCALNSCDYKADPPKEEVRSGYSYTCDDCKRKDTCRNDSVTCQTKEPLYTPDQLAILNALYTLGWISAIRIRDAWFVMSKAGAMQSMLQIALDARVSAEIYVIFENHKLESNFDIAKAVGK